MKFRLAMVAMIAAPLAYVAVVFVGCEVSGDAKRATYLKRDEFVRTMGIERTVCEPDSEMVRFGPPWSCSGIVGGNPAQFWCTSAGCGWFRSK